MRIRRTALVELVVQRTDEYGRMHSQYVRLRLSDGLLLTRWENDRANQKQPERSHINAHRLRTV